MNGCCKGTWGNIMRMSRKSLFYLRRKSEQQLSYYGTATALSVARRYLAGASVGNYALAMGGNDGSRSKVVDAYNTSLQRSTPTALSVARERLAGASVGDYALAMGGYTGSYSDVVDAYQVI